MLTRMHPSAPRALSLSPKFVLVLPTSPSGHRNHDQVSKNYVLFYIVIQLTVLNFIEKPLAGKLRWTIIWLSNEAGSFNHEGPLNGIMCVSFACF